MATSVFKSNAEFWGWDDKYITETVHRHVQAIGKELEDFLSPESPLVSHAHELVDDLQEAGRELKLRHDPCLRPSKRQQHKLTSVNSDFSSHVFSWCFVIFLTSILLGIIE